MTLATLCDAVARRAPPPPCGVTPLGPSAVTREITHSLLLLRTIADRKRFLFSSCSYWFSP